MKSIIIFTLLSICTMTFYGQEVDSTKQVILNDTPSALKKKLYVIKINKGGLNPSFGYLQSLNNATLRITSSPLPYGTSTQGKLLSYSTIDLIDIHIKGRAGRGALIGAIGGIVLGGVIAAATYSKPTPGSGRFTYGFFDNLDLFADIAGGGIVGLVLGLPIGVLAGGHANKYIVDKDKQAFDNMRTQLMELYSIKKSVTQKLDQ